MADIVKNLAGVRDYTGRELSTLYYDYKAIEEARKALILSLQIAISKEIHQSAGTDRLEDLLGALIDSPLKAAIDAINDAEACDEPRERERPYVPVVL